MLDNDSLASRDPLMMSSATIHDGDTLQTWEIVEVEEGAEPVGRYTYCTSDLFYPICIGDVLEDTYRIEHKLGHGESSTVWLAHDIKRGKDVALKIMIAEYKGEDEGEDEYRMQKEIIRTVQDTSKLVTYLTTFSLRGCNSCKGNNHRVLVFPVRGPSFSDTLYPEMGAFFPGEVYPPSFYVFKSFSMATRMSAARQLLQTLECLHKAGIVHNDLNRGNVMWGVAPLDNLDTKTKYEYLGRPLKITLPSDVWKKGELVKRLDVPKSLITDTVYLGDFGLATKAGTDIRHKMLSHVNIISHAPERFHNLNSSFASDMWSYMCIFIELYLGIVPWVDNNYFSMVSKMVTILGSLPKQWKGCYNSYVTAFNTCDNSWYDQRRKPNPKYTLEKLIKRERPEVGSVELYHLLNIMSKGFCYSPEGRLSATELLQDPSFQAVMEIHCR
ncbi:Protein kinase-like domain containing protein [Elaphomyces granulatus]